MNSDRPRSQNTDAANAHAPEEVDLGQHVDQVRSRCPFTSLPCLLNSSHPPPIDITECLTSAASGDRYAVVQKNGVSDLRPRLSDLLI